MTSELVAAYFEDGGWNVLDTKDPIDEIADGLWYGDLALGDEDTWAVGTVDEGGQFYPLVQATYTNNEDADCLAFARKLYNDAIKCVRK